MISCDYAFPKTHGMFLGERERKLAISLLDNQMRNCGNLKEEYQKGIPLVLGIWEKLKYIKGVPCHKIGMKVLGGTITRRELDFIKSLAIKEAECLKKSINIPNLEADLITKNVIASRVNELLKFQKLEYTEV